VNFKFDKYCHEILCAVLGVHLVNTEYFEKVNLK